MKNLAPIVFEYKQKTYSALLQKNFQNIEGQYHITIMNSELENLLSGHDVLVIDESGECNSLKPARDLHTRELILSIGYALRQGYSA
jgi:hypothetical protein